MAAIDLTSFDYVQLSLNQAFKPDDIQCICQCLNIHRGKYWADPNFGSRLYTLRRSKDVARTVLLAKQYAEEALAHFVPTRFRSIAVEATQRERHRIELNIDVTTLSNRAEKIQYFVSVGG